jgi:NADPH:quinone reductase-like Zn-dependent oxidoreductase
MKAIVQEAYGLPDVLKLREVETPSIEDQGVLVRVHAASVNALDWHITRGMLYLVRIGGRRGVKAEPIEGNRPAQGRVVA